MCHPQSKICFAFSLRPKSWTVTAHPLPPSPARPRGGFRTPGRLGTVALHRWLQPLPHNHRYLQRRKQRRPWFRGGLCAVVCVWVFGSRNRVHPSWKASPGSQRTHGHNGLRSDSIITEPVLLPSHSAPRARALLMREPREPQQKPCGRHSRVSICQVSRMWQARFPNIDFVNPPCGWHCYTKTGLDLT